MAQITIILDDEKVDDFLEGFLATYPVPVDEEGEPQYTTVEWIKKCGIDFYLRTYRLGKKKLLSESINGSDILS